MGLSHTLLVLCLCGILHPQTAFAPVARRYVASHSVSNPSVSWQQQQHSRSIPFPPPCSYQTRQFSVLKATSSVSTFLEDNDDDNDDDGTASPLQVEQEKQRTFHWTRPTLQIAVPALIGMMADPLLSLMDTAFIGRVGAIELASLGACTSIFHLAFNAFRATTTATTSLVATSLQRSHAAAAASNGNTTATSSSIANPEEAQQVIQLSMTFGIVVGIALWIGLRLCGTYCLFTMGIPRTSALFPPASAYLNARLWASPAVLMIVVAEGAFRGYANTTIPLVASAVAALLNLVLDPLMIFPPLNWGVRGAAAATAISQWGAAMVYVIALVRCNMLPSRKRNSTATTTATTTTTTSPRHVIQTIVGANVAMMAKQGSLLLAWAYATAKATRLGPAHVAAHQVALTFWLIFAIGLDGAAVSAQVLMSRAAALQDKPQIRSLTRYMAQWAFWQGLASTALIGALGRSVIPQLFTPNPIIRKYLHQLMPTLAWQQVLISLTLVMESLAVGGNQFNLLAVGTTLSTILAMTRLRQATDVVSIWSRGIVTLFAGRLVTALVGVCWVNGLFPWKRRRTTKDNLE